MNTTLSLIAKLYLSETHEITAALINTPGAENNIDIYPSFARLLYALLGVVGPELESSNKTRGLCTILYQEFKNESDPYVIVEAIKCVQQFVLFASKDIDFSVIVPFLQRQLDDHGNNTLLSSSYLKRKASLNCLYQLGNLLLCNIKLSSFIVQRDAKRVLKASNGQLEKQLFSLLDTETEIHVQEEIKDVMIELLKCVSVETPSRWFLLCKDILSKSSGTNVAMEVSHDDDDNEVFEKSEQKKIILFLPRWRTQLFAIHCLSRILSTIRVSGVDEHLDLVLARKNQKSAVKSDFLVFKLGDWIRIAFNTATTNVHQLRIAGLSLLQEILDVT